jgi:hypothetical protein
MDSIMATRKVQRNKRRSTRNKRKSTPWNDLVKKVHMEMKRKDKNASLGDAMKEASKRKKEMKH